MEKRFINQVAIVTGGASGIGGGIAERLASEGCQVIIFDLNRDSIRNFLRKLSGKGLAVKAKFVDISSQEEVRMAVREVHEMYGRIDIMVNSAGIVGPTATRLEDYSLADFQKVVEVNLTGSFLMTKAVIPYMKMRSYGRILLISSIGGKEGNPGMAGYAASKSGVMGLVKGIGKEYAENGITVNGLAPAVIATPMNLDTDSRMLEYMKAKIPMKRLGTVEEAAAISTWIVSPEASFNTGFVFDLSGGRATF